MADLKPAGVYARHTAMFDCVDRMARAEKLFTLPTPVSGLVHGRLGYLLFSDAQGNSIFKWTNESSKKHKDKKDDKDKQEANKKEPAKSADEVETDDKDDEKFKNKGNVEFFRVNTGGARGMTLDHQGRLLMCESTARRVTRREKDGKITVLAERINGKPLAAPNDLIYGIDGSVYFTDVPLDPAAGPSAVYQISRTQIPGASQLRPVSQECARPAGVALSPKQNLLYVSDAARRNIRVHTINADGTLAAGSVFAEFASSAPGVPGGLKTDEKGNVYAAGLGGLWVFSAAGRHLGTVVLPELPTNCNWGAEFNSLYITAGSSLYHLATRVAGTRTF